MGVYGTLLTSATAAGPILLGYGLADTTGSTWLGVGAALTAWVFTATTAVRSLGPEDAQWP